MSELLLCVNCERHGTIDSVHYCYRTAKRSPVDGETDIGTLLSCQNERKKNAYPTEYGSANRCGYIGSFYIGKKHRKKPMPVGYLSGA